MRATELFPLPATQAELERRKKAAGENRRMMRGLSIDENSDRNGAVRSPGAMLARHELIASIARLLQEMVQSDGAY